jgi:hypothetical protein
MKRFVLAAGAMLAWAAGSMAAAADFDGSKLLICATVEAMDCASGQTCTKGRPEDIDAPAFMRIDFKKKTIVGPKRTTKIVSLERGGQQLLLQGTELGYGWTLALDQASGKMAVTLANREGVFVLFGSCTPL